MYAWVVVLLLLRVEWADGGRVRCGSLLRGGFRDQNLGWVVGGVCVCVCVCVCVYWEAFLLLLCKGRGECGLLFIVRSSLERNNGRRAGTLVWFRHVGFGLLTRVV